MSASFVHLHVASGWSFRHGASHPEGLVARAAELGMDTLALTDRDGVHGAVKFVKACLVHGVRPILGVDLAVVASSTMQASAAPPGATRKRSPIRGGATVDPRHPRVVVLARAGRRTPTGVGAGWAAVNRLVSAAHRGERGTPVVGIADIAEHAAGGDLLVLLGPASELGRALAARRPDLARAILDTWRDRIGSDRVAVEVVSHHGSPDGRPLEQASAPSDVLACRMLGFAREHGVRAVLANAVRYATSAGAATADVLDATRRLVALEARHVDRRTAEAHLKSPAAMQAVAERFTRDRDDLRRLLESTREVAESCVLDPAEDVGLGRVHLPELSVIDSSGAPSSLVLRARCEAGLETRYGRRGQHRDVRERLESELDVIDHLGYWTYFLTVAEVCDLIRSMGVRVAARGSGAGSLVLHLLGVSGVDPMRHGLLMERFLTVQRQALPDVDIDVESARRTEIYERIFERFGSERCACVSMTDTYRVRHAIRDVGAALGLPPGEVDTIAKAFPHIRARDARAALRDLPELRASGLGRTHADGSGLDTFFALVESLDGLPRHIALHPCGVLLSDSGLLDRTAVESSFLGFPMSQFDKDDVEDLGLLKLDVLGIRMQSSMAHAVSEIRRVDGIEVSLDDEDCVAHDDPATFALIQSTRTLGCFQIESPGQRELIGKFGPETFEDLITDISLFRPGPVKSDMVTPFLRARQGWTQPEYLHERLRPALEETFGVVVFHEQVIRIIAELTGCRLDEADEARRELGSPDGQAAIREWIYPLALARGFTLPEVERIWAVLQAFASFGFCKAHAAAFTLPTYQSAWLKAHHPAAFLAGVLTYDPGMYPKRLLLDDARQCGITVLGLDVNTSEDVYRVERLEGSTGPDPAGYGIRLSLAEVKGITDDEVARIVEGRPYAALADFWQRAGVSRPVVERLVVAGAFDSMYGLRSTVPVRRRGQVNRRDLLLQVADLDRWSRTLRRSTAAQLAFDLDDLPETSATSGLPEMTGAECVRAELDVLGLDVSRHVVDFYNPVLEALGVTRSRQLLRCRSQAEVLVAGVKVATQTPPIRSGRRVVFLTLDDGTGPVDATFFEDAQGPYAATVFHSWLLLVRGEVRRTGPRGVSIRATGAWELSGLYAAWESGGLEGAYAYLAEADVLGGASMDEEGIQGWADSKSVRPVVARAPDAGTGTEPTRAGGMGQRRVLVHASGFRQSPYADVKTPGEDPKKPPRKLWHSSPGSSGA